MNVKVELEQAERFVSIGERHIAAQRVVVAELRREGRRTEDAEKLLETFERIQLEHVALRDRLKANQRS